MPVTGAIIHVQAGHPVPTDLPGRHMILTVVVEDEQGRTVARAGGPVVPGWGGPQAGLPGNAFAKVLRDVESGRAPVVSYWKQVETALGAYTRGQLALMLVVGVACFVGLVILRVPHAPALALIAGLTEAIPFVSPFIGGIPAVLLGLTVSWQIALLVAGWYVLVQQLEAHLLVLRIMHRAVGLNPFLVIVALIAGGTLKGVLGALLAIPVVAALQVLTRHIVLQPIIDKHANGDGLEVLVPGPAGRHDLEGERDEAAKRP